MKKLEKNIPVSGLITAIAGLIMVVMPNLTNLILVRGIGIALLINGIIRVVHYMRGKSMAAMMDNEMSIGLMSLVAGIILLAYPDLVISILPFLFGLYLIFGGTISIQNALDVYRFRKSSMWIFHLIVGIALIILGIVVISQPFSAAAVMTRFVGICILAEGIYMFIASLRVGKLRKEVINKNIIDSDDYTVS